MNKDNSLEKKGNIMFVRSHKDKNFSIVDLTNVLDQRLSWKAKGIFLYLISRPPEWKIWTNDLVDKSTDGQTSLYSGLKELEEAGYIHRVKRRDRKKQFFIGMEYHKNPT